MILLLHRLNSVMDPHILCPTSCLCRWRTGLTLGSSKVTFLALTFRTLNCIALLVSVFKRCLDADLTCLVAVNLTIVLTADAPFPASFNQQVRSTFVSVTGISDSRVTIVTSAKRSTTQSSELETELSIAPGMYLYIRLYRY